MLKRRIEFYVRMIWRVKKNCHYFFPLMFSETLFLFSVTTVTDDHKLWGLKQHDFLCYTCLDSESDMEHVGLSEVLVVTVWTL